MKRYSDRSTEKSMEINLEAGFRKSLRRRETVFAVLLSAVLLAGCGSRDDNAQETGNTPETENISGIQNVSEEQEENLSGSGAEDSAGGLPEEDAKEQETSDIEASAEEAELPDGTYTARFQTDSSMFRVNEACGGMGTLTVEDGEMSIHISLGSKKIINLYPGLAADAEKDGAVLLMPTEDTVTYSDGTTEEVYGFDVPVPALDTEFDLALIGTKGKWYDHKVSVSDPAPAEDKAPETETGVLEDGTYSLELTFEGGSGKAKILSPVTVCVTDGKAVATVCWSSPNYDYMLVDGEKYLPVNTEGDSVFEIPVLCFDEPMQVIGDTVAMSKPYEIEYTLTFHRPQE